MDGRRAIEPFQLKGSSTVVEEKKQLSKLVDTHSFQPILTSPSSSSFREEDEKHKETAPSYLPTLNDTAALPVYKNILIDEKDTPRSIKSKEPFHSIQSAQRISVIGNKFLILWNHYIHNNEGSFMDRYDEGVAHIFSLTTGKKLVSIQENDNDWRFWQNRRDFIIKDILYHEATKKLILAGGLRRNPDVCMGLRIYDKSPLNGEALSGSTKAVKCKMNDSSLFGIEHIDYINERYVIAKRKDLGVKYHGTNISILDIHNDFLAVDNIRFTEGNFAVSRKSKWAAFSHIEVCKKGNTYEITVNIYKYNDDTGKLTFAKKWKIPEKYVCHLSEMTILENGFLAVTGTCLKYSNEGRIEYAFNVIHVFDVDNNLPNKDEIPPGYELALSENSIPARRLLPLPNNTLCICQSVINNDQHTYVVALWDLKSRKERARFPAYDASFFNGYLALFDTFKQEIRFKNIVKYLGNEFIISRPLMGQAIEYFKFGLAKRLESYYTTSKTFNSGLIKRDITLTIEEIEEEKLKKRLEFIEKKIKVAAGLMLIVSFFVPQAIFGSALFQAISKIVTAVRKNTIRISPVLKELIPGMINIVHRFQRQHSLSPDDLIRHFSESFNDSHFQTFKRHAIRYFARRYENQINLFDITEARRLGDALGERVGEPFMLGLCPWGPGQDFNVTLRIVSNWVYYAANLPFMMKRVVPLPTFSTIEGMEVELIDVLSPAGFEVLDEKGESVHIEVEPAEQILQASLQAHRGIKKKTVPPVSLVSYCRATEQEVEQLRHQAEIKREIAKEYKSNSNEDKQQASLPSSIPQASVKALPKLTFLSKKHSLPFVIKDSAVGKINREIKSICFKIEDKEIDKLKKENKKQQYEISTLAQNVSTLSRHVLTLTQQVSTLTQQLSTQDQQTSASGQQFDLVLKTNKELGTKITTSELKNNNVVPLSTNSFAIFQPAPLPLVSSGMASTVVPIEQMRI